MVHLDRAGLFEDCFRIKERFLNKRIVINGLNEDGKKSIMLLAYFGIHVEGILVEEGKAGLLGCHYIGIPIIESLNCKDTRDCILLDIFEKDSMMSFNREEIRCDVLFPGFGKTIIYGAGQAGRKLAAFLHRCGVDIECFVDKDAFHKKQGVDGVPVKEPWELDHYERNFRIIVAIGDECISVELVDMLKGKGYSQTTYFDPSFFDVHFCYELCASREGVYHQVFWPYCLRYIYNFTQKEEKRLFLYSEDSNYLQNVCLSLRTLGIPVAAGLSANIPEAMDGSIKITDKWDLMYEEPDSFLVWALYGDEEVCRTFMNQSGMNKRFFVYGSTGPLMLDREYVMDTNLGYADSKGIRKYKNYCGSEHFLRLAILGGSTSDAELYYEDAWTKHMLDIASEQKINIELYVAATAGNSSAQELMRLIRDVIPKKPDIVISYSGINEISLTVENHPYTHPYMEELYRVLSDRKKGTNFFGAGKAYKYSMGEEYVLMDFWLENERMIHAICDEYGIMFLCFLQPYLYTKRNQEKHETELVEHCMQLWDGGVRERIKDFYDNMRECVQPYSWICDMTGVFDGITDEVYFDTSHVVSGMNRHLAKEILDIVMKYRQGV